MIMASMLLYRQQEHPGQLLMNALNKVEETGKNKSKKFTCIFIFSKLVQSSAKSHKTDVKKPLFFCHTKST